MTRTAKKWAGIALSGVIVALFLFIQQAEDRRLQGEWNQKYRRTQMQIGWQLINLRHEYSTQQIQVFQNTVLEIKELWYSRDVLFQVLHHQQSHFQADSLIKLEQLIDRRAPVRAIFQEIQRIEKINENNQPSTP